jgi:glutaredoxin
LLCLHKWPIVYFAMDEYKKEYTCPKCKKTKVIFISDKPEYIKVLPTDYYEYNARQRSKQLKPENNETSTEHHFTINS